MQVETDALISQDITEDELHRFISMGKLSASLIHEIASPLSAALIHLEGTNSDSLNLKAVRRNLMSLKSYLEAARLQLRQDSQTKVFYLDKQFIEIKRLLSPLAKSSEVNLLIEKMPHLSISGDHVKFQQVFANLIINAIEAYRDMDSSLKQTRLVRVRASYSNKNLALEVRDWGIGISAKDLDKLFDLFYTTKHYDNKGLGLGLAIVKSHIQQSFKGSISVSSNKRYGTSFKVKLAL